MKTFPDSPESESPDKLTLVNTSGIEIPVHEQTFLKLLAITEKGEKVIYREIEVAFVGEEEIVKVNREFLGHDYVTDIITFRYDENDTGAIEGTLYCCAPRILEQSKEFESTPEEEFMRVFVHGLLHLSGHNDTTDTEKKAMTALENRYLELLTKEM
jgi:probable rRNA maturation factor